MKVLATEITEDTEVLLSRLLHVSRAVHVPSVFSVSSVAEKE